MFDPLVSNKLWFAEGIGIWWTTPLPNGNRPTWTSQTINNSELIVDHAIVPPGGALIVAVQDRGTFYLTDPKSYPARDGPQKYLYGQSLIHGWALDYAKNDPMYVIGVFGTYTWYSTDGGKTWAKNDAQVPGVNAGGAIAAATSTNIVWFPGNNGRPGYTTDGGSTWSSALFNGSILSNGWSFSQYLNRHIVTADFVNSGTYYAYNYNSDRTGGVWRSTDGGKNWIQMHSIKGLDNTGGTDAVLTAVPGQSGHLFFTPVH